MSNGDNIFNVKFVGYHTSTKDMIIL